jgi:anti-sigma factor (TIGR02949 family)
MTMIDCREAVRRMWTYLSRSLDEVDHHELEEHLTVCQRCCGELEFSRELRARLASAEQAPMPPEVRSRVETAIRDEPRQAGGAT